jgi:DNA-binding SARP family transcriptional activator
LGATVTTLVNQEGEHLRPPAGPPAPERLTVQLIGNLRICRGEDVFEADQLGGPKPRQILEILFLHLGRPVSKEMLIHLLWGDVPPAGGQASLESYVSVLRRILQPHSGKDGPLRTATGGYYMDRRLVELDLDRFDGLLRRAEHADAGHAYELLDRAVAMSAEPLLGDELPAWAEEERSLHAARVLTARTLAAETAAELGHYDEAIARAGTVVNLDPINERAWTVLVLCLERNGQPTEGLQAYERCRRILLEELGCAPGPALQQAQARMLQATADADGELSEVFAALMTLHERSTKPHWEVRRAGDVLQEFMRRTLGPRTDLQPHLN